MNELKETLQRELENLNLKFDYFEDEALFLFSVNLNDKIGIIQVVIAVLEERYLVYAILPQRVSKARRSSVSEFLHRVNYSLIDGNFEMEYTTGKIRYKTFVNAKEMIPSGSVIRDSVLIPVKMCRKYGEGLLKVMTTKTNPESVINNIK